MTKELFTRIADVYDRMNHILSLGLDTTWRRRAVRLPSGRPARILDLACGTGDLSFALARAFPEATVLGLDLTPAMLERARAKNAYSRVSFAEADAETPLAPTLGPGASFDLVSCAFGFRNFEDKAAALRNVRQLLTPDGELLVLEFFRPERIRLGTLPGRWVALLARLFAPSRRDAYDHLRRTMCNTLSERAFIALAASKGLVVRERRFFFPCCSCLLFRRR